MLFKITFLTGVSVIILYIIYTYNWFIKKSKQLENIFNEGDTRGLY
jgi:cytochrome bd-type quinol oxidase subunit 2